MDKYRLKTIVSYIVLGCFGIILGLVLIEMMLRLTPRNLIDPITERSTRLQLYRLDPRVGWTLRPDAHYVHTTKERVDIPIETNSLGLRDNEHTYSKPDGIYRILVLGDSFSEALDV